MATSSWPCPRRGPDIRGSAHRFEGVIRQLTAVFIEVPEGYIAFVEELPGANTQGATIEEARENLKEAVAMVLEANRELAEKTLVDQKVTKEPFALSSS
jgi:predicted RNase H-like HicB family nuclease